MKLRVWWDKEKRYVYHEEQYNEATICTLELHGDGLWYFIAHVEDIDSGFLWATNGGESWLEYSLDGEVWHKI